MGDLIHQSWLLLVGRVVEETFTAVLKLPSMLKYSRLPGV